MIEIRETETFLRFISELRDRRARVKIAGRVDRLAFGREGDVASVGEGISELRIQEGAGEGVRHMNAKIKTSVFDAADHLDDADAIAIYLEDAFATNDPAYITHALGTVARAKGMTDIARKTGLSRESLYKALSAEGNPEFATILKVMSALDLKVGVRAG